MPNQLPPHICRSLGVTESDDPKRIVQRIQQAGDQVDLLASNDARIYLESLVSGGPLNQDIEIHDMLGEVPAWNFQEAVLDGETCGEVVQIPKILLSAAPSSSEKLLIRAWFCHATLIEIGGHFKPNVSVIEWHPGANAGMRQIIRALCGADLTNRASEATRIWQGARIFQLTSNSRVLNHKESEFVRGIFIGATTETASRWRFLSLYRVLEHAYLESVFEDLSARFFSEPKSALKDATDALGSEVEQFIRLVELHDLRERFEEIFRLNEEMVRNGNRFSTLVQREANKRQLREPFKRGVAVSYQIRSSIVHAGRTLILDKIKDGELALKAHLPGLEAAVMDFLGIQTN